MKILLVEDDIKLGGLTKRGLEQDNYVVDWLTDGQQALDCLLMGSEDYDLAILDRMLPSKEGLAICSDLRLAGINLPVIILTALGDLDDRIAGLDMGADDYIVKPFALNELSARIRTVLRRPVQILPLQLQVQDLVIDTTGRQAWRNKHEILLTNKEFALLELFMTHPGQVLDREQILSRVWDFSFNSFSNVIDVHMKNLRRKVDYGSKQQLFETVRGVGYKLNG